MLWCKANIMINLKYTIYLPLYQWYSNYIKNVVRRYSLFNCPTTHYGWEHTPISNPSKFKESACPTTQFELTFHVNQTENLYSSVMWDNIYHSAFTLSICTVIIHGYWLDMWSKADLRCTRSMTCQHDLCYG